MSGAKIQHEAPQPRQNDGRERSRLQWVPALTTERLGYVVQPLFDGVVQECFVDFRETQGHAVGLEKQPEEWLGIRGSHALPNRPARRGKTGGLNLFVGSALALPDLRQNLDHHLFLRS